jgi:uncharacterized protein (DUF983 family)
VAARRRGRRATPPAVWILLTLGVLLAVAALRTDTEHAAGVWVSAALMLALGTLVDLAGSRGRRRRRPRRY